MYGIIIPKTRGYGADETMAAETANKTKQISIRDILLLNSLTVDWQLTQIGSKISFLYNPIRGRIRDYGGNFHIETTTKPSRATN